MVVIHLETLSIVVDDLLVGAAFEVLLNKFPARSEFFVELDE